jgi:hypothetical protein
LIGDDGTRTELRADLVCPDRIKVYEAEGSDVSVALHVLEVAQGGHITLIGVVLPIKLHGDWASCVRLDRGQMARPKGEVWEYLEKVELAGAHARHAFADGRVDGGARNIAVFEYAPFGAAENGAGWQLLLELPLLG